MIRTVQVVHSVASSTIDDGTVRDVLAVVNQDGPNVDEHEESDVRKLLEREQEREDVVRQRLRISVKWVECMRGERCRHDPLVMRLMKLLVDQWVVLCTVDPINEEVGEHDEEGELKERVPSTHVPGGRLWQLVVDERVAIDFGNEPRRGEKGNDGHCAQCLIDLHAHLVLEVFWVVDGSLIEDKNIRKTSTHSIVDNAKDPEVGLVYSLTNTPLPADPPTM